MYILRAGIDNLEEMSGSLYADFFTGHLVWKTVLILVALLCVYWLVMALVRRRTRRWAVLYFSLLSAALIVWSLGTLAPLYWPHHPLAPLFTILRQIPAAAVPGLFCLHIWKQVSYKNITPMVVAACLFVPALLCWPIFTGALPPATSSPFPLSVLLDTETGFTAASAWTLVFYLYAALTIGKGLLLCLNVFYQMPRHMRRSTYYMLVGISLLLISLALTWVLPDSIPFDLMLFATALAMMCLFDAFFAVNSADVIATSRDFVFTSLSTMILVLGNNHRILDWNKKTAQALGGLPQPVYREPFQHYRQRMLSECNGRVSTHGDNIITTTVNGTETHYLLTEREIKNRTRRFGYLVEIAEVTRIYSVLRYLEDIATVDQLTGLYNRNAYLNMVRSLVEMDTLPLAVVVGDVNNLKRLNDTTGHLIGDELLVAVARAIAVNAPPTSYACRIGGDEYVLLLPNGEEEDARAFIENVTETCKNIQDDRFGSPSISWGYAVRTSSREEYNEVFAKADKMMYSDKRSRYQFTSSGMVPPAPEPETAPAEGTVSAPNQPPPQLPEAPTFFSQTKPPSPQPPDPPGPTKPT